MIISLDTETTGIDLAHGAKPFLVTTCDLDGVIRFWEWDVCPLTREPQVPDSDLVDIAEMIDAAETIYLQNSKFDARALAAIGIQLPWEKVRDTLAMGHLLASNHPHNLTDMVIEYLGVDIEKYELKIKEVTRACRSIVKKDHPDWKIADEGVDGMPSVKASSNRDDDKPWKNDMWLPKAYIKAHTKSMPDWRQGDEHFGHGWADACSRYANADSEYTLYLGLEMEKLIRERGYWAIYEHRSRLPQVACEMECYGVTALGEHTEQSIAEYECHVAEAEASLVKIAAKFGHELELAKGAAINDNMREFFYGSVRQSCPRCSYFKRVKHWGDDRPEQGEVCPKCIKPRKRPASPGMRHKLVTTTKKNLGLRVIYGDKTGNATLDTNAMQEYLLTLEGEAYEFIKMLADKRGYDTALAYRHAYRRYWIPVEGTPSFFRIHPSLNPFGTDHLRWSSNSPNMQNVSTGDDDGGLNARECFGPCPDREWWKMDFKNLEKRIPAYECMEPKLVEIFEKPNDPPYWGSDHNLIASLLFPEEYWPTAEVEGKFKKEHPRLAKRAKNTNFAKQYGAGKRKCELTSGVRGAFDLIDRGLPELAKLQAYYLNMAKKTGWVQTLPDRTVDPERGYPILASRTEDGGVLSTTPFNYHVSGTACWAKNTALLRCADQCRKWRAEGFDAWVSLEVHDELLFDFPRGATMEENLPRAVALKKLMEQAGEDLVPRIPTPIAVEYTITSWADGVAV
jgi:DNA polymerase I-like protein with 3'-5' exonuclease and polymerase domains